MTIMIVDVDDYLTDTITLTMWNTKAGRVTARRGDGEYAVKSGLCAVSILMAHSTPYYMASMTITE